MWWLQAEPDEKHRKGRAESCRREFPCCSALVLTGEGTAAAGA